ncbi:piggyBac transposable element-derived protein 4-like [Macrobrachium rosenbergii]|uniref:piggyBac transposable element-derived protein 4-like n=1 Tax=Macrobrachium rosenbergii TaxID=79674 RepID=UPI0034D5C44C
MSTRAVRKSGEQGKLAPIYEVWHKFIEACQVNYKAGSCVTVDESLVSFRGSCSFKVYMPSKPNKYGIKIWCIVDATNAYLLNAQIYSGKGPDGPERQQASRVVRDLTTTIANSGRNVTCDIFFTEFNLALELLSKNITLLGTLRKNKQEIPPSFQASRHHKEQ